MNEQLQNKLVEIITGMQSMVSKAGDFAMTELPDIAMQYVLYGRIKTAAISLFLFLISSIALYAAWWAFKNPWNNDYYPWDVSKKRSESNYTTMTIGIAVGSVCMVTSFAQFDFLVWFAPKVWLIKELAILVK